MPEPLLPTLAVVPERWYQAPPETLVVGDGPYTSALAAIFGAEAMTPSALETGPAADVEGSYPQVLGELSRVFIVMSAKIHATAAVRSHDAVWHWVEKLAPAGDQHELAFVFITVPFASQTVDRSLAAGLALASFEAPVTGHAIWRASGSLRDLFNLLVRMRPLDLLPLRARRRADAKHAALARLLEAAGQEDATHIRKASQAVLQEFTEREYLLDVFCREPSHPHGNQMRRWLKNVVAGDISQEQLTEEAKQLGNWLAVETTR